MIQKAPQGEGARSLVSSSSREPGNQSDKTGLSLSVSGNFPRSQRARSLAEFAYRFFAILVPKSDAMFFLDVSPEVAYERIQEGRKRREMFEQVSSLKEARVKGLSLASIDA